jgi:hypothetical protein
MDTHTTTNTSADADRARRYRQRKRSGMLVLTVEANEVALAQALVDARLLKPQHIDNRPAITHAAQKLVDIFVRKK